MQKRGVQEDLSELISQTQDKKKLLFTGIINTRGYYAHNKFYVMQPITRVASNLSSYDMMSDQRNKNACDSRLDAEDVVIDGAMSQRKSS